MSIKVKKRGGESTSSFIYRFSKRVQRAGILKEAKKRRFYKRSANKTKQKSSALYRVGKKKEVDRLRKLGLL